jgi:hypothetical protein
MSHFFALEQGFISIAILGAIAFALFVVYTFVVTWLHRLRKAPSIKPPPRREPVPSPVNDDDDDDEEWVKEFG